MTHVTYVMPDRAWKNNDDLRSPCRLEQSILVSVLMAASMIRDYMKHCEHDTNSAVDNTVYTRMISLQLRERYLLPDMTDLAESLTHVCKQLVGHDASVVKSFFDHYAHNGTTGFDVLGDFLHIDSDTTFSFFIYVLDIKSAVYELISRLYDLRV